MKYLCQVETGSELTPCISRCSSRLGHDQRPRRYETEQAWLTQKVGALDAKLTFAADALKVCREEIRILSHDLETCGFGAETANPDSESSLNCDTKPVGSFSDLTARQSGVLQLLGAGLSNAEIAHQLRLSLNTAESRVSNISVKAGARNRVDAATKALMGQLHRPQ